MWVCVCVWLSPTPCNSRRTKWEKKRNVLSDAPTHTYPVCLSIVLPVYLPAKCMCVLYNIITHSRQRYPTIRGNGGHFCHSSLQNFSISFPLRSPFLTFEVQRNVIISFFSFFWEDFFGGFVQDFLSPPHSNDVFPLPQKSPFDRRHLTSTLDRGVSV